jgi:hypothetical protein
MTMETGHRASWHSGNVPDAHSRSIIIIISIIINNLDDEKLVYF